MIGGQAFEGGTGIAPLGCMDSKLLAQIRILSSDQILPFEWPQSPEHFLDVDLGTLSMVRHPFLVSPLEAEEYLLLCDTGYYRALSEGGLGHFPVQVCHPDEVNVVTERLGLDTFTAADLSRLAAKYPEQIVINDTDPDRLPPLGFLPVQFRFSNSVKLAAYFRHSGRVGCPPPLEHLFRAITQRGRYLAALDLPSDDDSLTRLATITGTMQLPSFTLDDLGKAALAERHFPPGIVRVSCKRRMLDIDFPMSVLASPIPASEKEAFFRDLVTVRCQNRRTAVYEGQVYLLNQQMFS